MSRLDDMLQRKFDEDLARQADADARREAQRDPFKRPRSEPGRARPHRAILAGSVVKHRTQPGGNS